MTLKLQFISCAALEENLMILYFTIVNILSNANSTLYQQIQLFLNKQKTTFI